MDFREGCSLLDLDRGLPVTPADVAALRRARRQASPTPQAYLVFLASLPQPTREDLKRRPLLTGKPFRLPF